MQKCGLKYVIHSPVKKLNFLLRLSMVTATFLMTSPLCYLLKPDTQPHDESMQRYVPFIFVVSTTSWIILGLSLLARKNPCVIFSEQAKEAKATLFRSVEYAVSTTAKGNSLNEAAF